MFTGGSWKRVVGALFGLALVATAALAQHSGNTDIRGYFEILVAPGKAITGTVSDCSTGQPLRLEGVTVTPLGPLDIGTRVRVEVSGYQPGTFPIRHLASSWVPGRGSYTTYGLGDICLNPLTGTGGTGPTGPFTLFPLQDATISGVHNRRGNNYGSEDYLLVTPPHSGYVINNEHRTLIQFDLSQIPAGTPISRATLRLCVWEFYGDQLGVILRRITRPWQEHAVTWSSHHSDFDYTFEVASETLSGLTSYDWVEFDVTADVQNALLTGDPHYGWMLIPRASYYGKFTQVKFYSWEGGAPNPYAVPGTHPATDRRPVLVIEFGPAPGPLPIIDQTMCRDVQPTSPYDPIDPTTTFTTQDRQAVAWVKFGPVLEDHRIRFEWYYLSPTGPSRVHLYQHIIPHPHWRGETQWNWYVVWSSLRIKGTLYARIPRPSQWEVRVFVDGSLATTLQFTITD
jgi:hypothetical protein